MTGGGGDLSELLANRASGASGGEIAIEVEGGPPVTWRELDANATEVASALGDAGHRKGDAVVVMSGDRARVPSIVHGVLRAGGVVLPVAYSTPGTSLAPLLEKGHAAFAVVDEPSASLFAHAPVRSLEQAHIIRLDDVPPISEKSVAVVIFTSGSTGTPKAVMLTHSNMLSATKRMARVRNHGPSDRHLSYLSFGHFAEQFMSVWLHVVAGYRCVVTQQRDLVNALAMARATFVMGVPVQWTTIADALALTTGSAKERLEQVGLNGLRLAIGTGAPLAPDVHQALGSYGIEICEMYGMTESTGAATYNAPSRRRSGSVGQALPGSRIELSTDGEIRIVGAEFQSPGYVDQPEETRATFQEDGIHTGDIGTLDDDGYLYITGRKKELLVLATGKKVHPAALEARLQSLPGVRYAAVYGEGKRFLVALLDVEESRRAEIARLVGTLNQDLPKHERIRHHFIVEPLSFETGELTASGKTRRGVLEKRYSAQLRDLFNS